MRTKLRDSGGDGVRPKGLDNEVDCDLVHDATNAIFYHNGQAIDKSLRHNISGSINEVMADDRKPFEDIAERLRWHREVVAGLTQKDYAEKIGVKRPAYSQWEAGLQRLSLNGALALRRTFGLSLDFLFEGIDDALPMSLRNAWRDRPSDMS